MSPKLGHHVDECKALHFFVQRFYKKRREGGEVVLTKIGEESHKGIIVLLRRVRV